MEGEQKDTKQTALDGRSPDVAAMLREKLSALMPEAFTEGKIDWEKLRAALGEEVNFDNERYVLNWAGKSGAFRSIRSPTSKTLSPTREESLNFDGTGNIFIEGENLEALKVLQKSYFGRIKMVYIDPPYNTGNDSFVYNDNFSETRNPTECARGRWTARASCPRTARSERTARRMAGTIPTG